MRTHRTEHRHDCTTRHRTRCNTQPLRLQRQQRQPRRTALQPHSAATIAAPCSCTHRTHSKLNALFSSDTTHQLFASSSPAGNSCPLRHRPLRGLHCGATPDRRSAPPTRRPSKREHAGHIANNDSLNSHATDVRGGARPQAPHRPPNPCLCTHRCRPRRSHTKPRHGKKLEFFFSFTAVALLRHIEWTLAHFHGSSKPRCLSSPLAVLSFRLCIRFSTVTRNQLIPHPHRAFRITGSLLNRPSQLLLLTSPSLVLAASHSPSRRPRLRIHACGQGHERMQEATISSYRSQFSLNGTHSPR